MMYIALIVIFAVGVAFVYGIMSLLSKKHSQRDALQPMVKGYGLLDDDIWALGVGAVAGKAESMPHDMPTGDASQSGHLFDAPFLR